MVRIITGTAKNKRLKTPNIQGYRGVQEIAKGAVFSVVGQKVFGSYCLDLFAGSGNLGLEALSRGAKHCDFVDDNKDAIKVIEENIRNCQFEEKSEVFFREAVKFATNTDRKYDIIFVDPFYNDHSHVFLMKNLEEILNDNGQIVFFHGQNLKMEDLIKDTKLQVVDSRKFGASIVDFIEN